MGTAEAQAIAEQIVRQATAGGREARTSARSTFAEYRSARERGRVNLGADENLVFWKYLTAPPVLFGASPDMADWSPNRFLIEPLEQRALSKATGAAGGFAVPADFDAQITSARRARNVIGNAARVILTSHGRAIPLPTATAHGVGAWMSENAAVTPSDDTFAQVTVNAYKATTKTIVSEELAQDALDDFDRYLADELGQRLALLEETAFATGDGAGKPHGITHSTNGVATVAAATGSATGFKLADVRAVWAALPPAYEPNATWIMSPSAFASLANLTDTADGLVLPSVHNENPTLYSRPVLVSPELPAAAANARSVVVGDFQAGYAVRRVRGLGVHRQTELHSDSGQVGYRLFARVDGRVVLPDALRILTNSAT